MAEKKRYRSALRSERLLQEAFIRLVEHEGRERVTVAEVCREADLNRSTFYAHYDNVDALGDSIIGKLTDGLAEIIAQHAPLWSSGDYRAVIDLLGSYVDEHRSTYRLLIMSQRSFGFVERLRSSLLEAVGLEAPEDMVRFDFFAGGLTCIYRTWVLGQYGAMPIEQANELAANLIEGCMRLSPYTSARQFAIE